MSKIIDLTYDIREGMTTFPRPWHPYVEITQLGRHHVEGRETRKITLGTHTGTHMDAPLHMIPRSPAVGAYDLDVLCGEAQMFDFTGINKNCIHASDLQAALDKSGFDTPRPRILLNFGHDAWVNDRMFYRKFPYLADSAARWIIDHGILLVGMDTPMPDWSQSEDMPIHRALLSNGIVIVEYMCNLGKLNDTDEFTLIVAPLKISEADGAPVRAFAYY